MILKIKIRIKNNPGMGNKLEVEVFINILVNLTNSPNSLTPKLKKWSSQARFKICLFYCKVTLNVNDNSIKFIKKQKPNYNTNGGAII